jgi:hypothetical protein
LPKKETKPCCQGQQNGYDDTVDPGTLIILHKLKETKVFEKKFAVL